MIRSSRRRSLQWIGGIASVISLTLILSRILPPAYDFYGVYYPALRDVWSGRFSYMTSPGYLNPPWALVLMLPLGLFDVAVARALLLVMTFLALAWCMHDLRRCHFSYPLAAISAPMFALVWLGQLEVFSLLGVSIGYRAVIQRRPWLFAVAFLLLLIKPQETWLIVIVLLLGSMRRFAWIEWLRIALIIFGVALVTSLWLGGVWLDRMGGGAATYSAQWQNFSLWRLAEIMPIGIVVVLAAIIACATFFALKRVGLSRAGLGLAAAAGNVLSPYLTAPHLIMTMSFGWGLSMDRAPKWSAIVYLTSLTPLLRTISGDQTLNRLDVIFPVLVLIVLIDAVRRTACGAANEDLVR